MFRTAELAAHSPEDGNATDHAVLRVSDGPYRRDSSDTDRRLRALAPPAGRSLNVTKVAVYGQPAQVPCGPIPRAAVCTRDANGAAGPLLGAGI
jgi:hypothetical protein